MSMLPLLTQNDHCPAVVLLIDLEKSFELANPRRTREERGCEDGCWYGSYTTAPGLSSSA